MKIRELFSDESKWTKYDFARDSKGRPVTSDAPQACRWCLLGAIIKCYPGDEKFKVIHTLVEHLGPSIPHWNDRNSTTFKNVVDLVARLDI
jgi:hypothetical protein